MTDALQIVEATAGDAETIQCLAREVFISAFGASLEPDDLSALLDRDFSESAVGAWLEEDTILLVRSTDEASTEGASTKTNGFAQIGPGKEGELWLKRLYVSPGAQGSGLGTKLLKEALEHSLVRAAPSIKLDVWEFNPGAIRLYERFGFAVIDEYRFPLPSGGFGDRDFIMERKNPVSEQA